MDNFVRTNVFYHPDESIFRTVSFKIVPKKNNLASPPETKKYPCAAEQGEVGLNRLACIVASQSTVSRADWYAVIDASTQAIAEKHCQ